MAELDNYLILLPCLLLGFVVGRVQLSRVGTLWATLPLAVLGGLLASNRVAAIIVRTDFGWCATSVTSYSIGTYLAFGTLAVITIQCAAALGKESRRCGARPSQ